MSRLHETLQALEAVDMAMQRNAEMRGGTTDYADGWHDCLKRMKRELRAEPLTDEQLQDAIDSNPYCADSYTADGFSMGVRYAERVHGIGADKP